MRIVLTLMFTCLLQCRSADEIRLEQNAREHYGVDFSRLQTYLSRAPVATAFDFPLCRDGVHGCYDAQPFGVSEHLGEDWNRAGNNKDLGSPVYAIADGVVVFAADIGNGWGKVLRIVHRLPENSPYPYVESLYAHFTQMLPQAGDVVRRGDKIGTLGTAGGIYEAHLHLELRHVIALPVGGGYGSDQTGYLEPKKFIRAHR
ncbi:MAG: M23 family metallopeptidase [Leptospiraceae bacterium]|nr:M23 family metallopeptidase [Leptospiraceae bacterium]